MRRRILALASLFTLSACGWGTSDGRIAVALIGRPDSLEASGPRLSFAAQQIHAATHQGLVRLDDKGQLVAGLAERWIVTDDGLSYIFRIREYDLPDGKRLTARAVQQALTRTIRSFRGTTLGLDLAPVHDVRAMTGRVIEIRLDAPMPSLLQLLAEPELGIAVPGLKTGPMAMRAEGQGAVMLSALPPEQRGLPSQEDWADNLRQVVAAALPARQAVKGFGDGRFQLVLGGTLSDLTLADPGPLSRGTIRLEAPIGLLGIDILSDAGFLAEPRNREALAMALDRAKLIQPFNIAGWKASTRIVPTDLPGSPKQESARWGGMSQSERQAEAARRVSAWAAQHGGAPSLRISLPEGPGADTLFQGLAAQYKAIGVIVKRVGPAAASELALRDRVARFPGTLWFLNQFNCSVSIAICSPEVDELVAQAVRQGDQAGSDFLLARAANTLSAFNPYIPIGAPIRWSLARADVTGFAENPRAFHPLFPLSRAPI